MARQRVGGFAGRACIAAFAAAALLAGACSNNSSSSNSSGTSTPTSPSTPTTPATTTLAGTVTDVVSASPVSGATVAVQGKSTTTGSDGKYSISGLSNGAATVTCQHQGHVNFTQSVTLSGATTANIGMTPSFAAKSAGTWSGTWKNTTFGSTGTITMTITIDSVAQTEHVVLDVNGNVFGSSDPPAETFDGSYSSSGVAVSGKSNVFGTGSINITPAGQITGSSTQIPNPAIAKFDFTGTATTAQINITYTVTFTAGGTATGTATLTKS